VVDHPLPERVEAAYAACLTIARTHYENFPVASRLLPASLRPHVAAIYAFARGADDIADEPGLATDERLRRLDDWAKQLHGAPQTDVFVALADTRGTFNLPLHLFDDLLSAFRQDVTKSRYETWSEVFDYCRRSANPIGRLVLRLAGQARDDTDRWSDAVCTALQLTNFWQDFAIDWRRGRLYLPGEVWMSKRANPRDLDHGIISESWRAALHDATAVTRDLFQEGRPVCDAVRGRLRYELRATWLGGTRILERLAASDYAVFARRPKLRAMDAVMIGWRALRWRSVR
jgi:squalene synthase HpnC